MLTYEETIKKFYDLINNADAILVGAASGMSSASGFDHYYNRSREFVEYFGEFERKYGFHSSFNGFYHPYKTQEAHYAYLSRMATCIYEEELGITYIQIKEILENKIIHILTTNQDGQFFKIYPAEMISAIQGDFRYLQCSRRCKDELYDAKLLRDLNNHIDPKTLLVESKLLPRCPYCNSLLEPWVRGPSFLEGKKYREEYQKVNNFIKANQNKNIIFLELGVERMTPMFIQEPFWNLTYALDKAFYININPAHSIVPNEIKNKGLRIPYDIKQFFEDVLIYAKNKRINK